MNTDPDGGPQSAAVAAVTGARCPMWFRQGHPKPSLFREVAFIHVNVIVKILNTAHRVALRPSTTMLCISVRRGRQTRVTRQLGGSRAWVTKSPWAEAGSYQPRSVSLLGV